MHGSPSQLAGVFAAALESDPIAAAIIKEHCPPEKLIRLLDLGDWLNQHIFVPNAVQSEPLLDELAGTALQQPPAEHYAHPSNLPNAAP